MFWMNYFNELIDILIFIKKINIESLLIINIKGNKNNEFE
jgi:hypothetical protein